MKQQRNVLSYKFGQRQRLVFIECMLYWEGEINSSKIVDYFDVSAKTAKEDLREYESFSSNKLTYNPSLKQFLTNDSFELTITSGQINEYLSFVQPVNFELATFASQMSPIEVLHNHRNQIDPDIFKRVQIACKKGLILEVDYRSLSKPDKQGRMIKPHTIVFANHRWHVRALCLASTQQEKPYKDFVLSRIVGLPEIVEEEKKGLDFKDVDWLEYETVTIRPDKRLSNEQQLIVQQDFNMRAGKLDIKLRRAHIKYLINDLNIDEHNLKADPVQQQITIADIERIKSMAF
ncbi:WYL domain-containing protein [Psychrosphaera haliotis]|uniref:WYL domain-containing protein n=1 Tax=Psychrosphaera haliotis TaxID=555083 RepID=UPI0031D807EF